MSINKRNALLSVYNKNGIVEFAKELFALGWTLYASGGTARHLSAVNIPVIDVATLVGGGAILGHRVVTLSREVHAALLAKDTAEDIAELEQLGLPWIDLVCVDMYPMEAEIAREGSTLESVIEKTDIGGPTMLRSAAKGGRIVICDPADRQPILDKLRSQGDISAADRQELAAKAEFTVALYCLASTRYFSGGNFDGFAGRKVEDLKYGENPQQNVGTGLFSFGTGDPLAIDKFTLVDGRPKGFINNTDLDRGLAMLSRIAATFTLNGVESACGYIAIGNKHGNACGVGISASSPIEALRRMVEGNPLALFGGCVLTNFDLGVEEAKILRRHCVGTDSPPRIFDIIATPGISTQAISKLRRKDGNHRLLVNPALLDPKPDTARRFRCLRGSFQVQPVNPYLLDVRYLLPPDFEGPKTDLQVIGQMSEQQLLDALLAKAICDTSTSNTITAVKSGMLLGNGTCRPSRVSATWGCFQEAKSNGLSLQDAVLASDSFFPFTDGPQEIIEAGIKVVVTTSGSKADEAVFSLFANAGVAVIAVPNDKGRGFDGH